MKSLCFLLLCLVLRATLSYGQTTRTARDATPLKPRMLVLTDISVVEPDDMESLVRLLVHADLYEIEGLVATTGWSLDSTNAVLIILIFNGINAYEQDLPNLLKRSSQSIFQKDETKQKIGYWPTPDYLRTRTVFGSKHLGMSYIGEQNDSPGSELIIKLVDEADERPLWITLWGGGNTLAQAIWRVKQERSETELKTFLRKLRVFAITDQDRKNGYKVPFATSAHQWMRREFEKDLQFIWDECAWNFQNNTGRQKWGDYYKHIQNHGSLGSLYPKYVWGVEGDTPSYLHITPNGLNNPEVPTQIGWAGYFEKGLGKDSLTYAFTNYQGNAKDICSKYVNYFYPAIFNNFAARMDWAKDGKGNRNPVINIDGNEDIAVLRTKAKPEKKIVLDASKTYDPDGDQLTYKWWIMVEAGTYPREILIEDSQTSKASLVVPVDAEGKTFHLICEVTDNGTHSLSSYRRIVVEATSK